MERKSDRVRTGIFVVHGREEAMKQAVARRLLDNVTNEDAMMLAEQPNCGRTIAEKLDGYVDANFVAVLLTPDDQVVSAGAGRQVPGPAECDTRTRNVPRQARPRPEAGSSRLLQETGGGGYRSEPAARSLTCSPGQPLAGAEPRRSKPAQPVPSGSFQKSPISFWLSS